MSFKHRAMLSTAFFILGMEFIYRNMEGTRNASRHNPAWQFVSMIHSGVITAIFIMLALAGLFVCFMIYEKYQKFQEEIEREDREVLVAQERRQKQELWEETQLFKEFGYHADFAQKQFEAEQRKTLEQEKLKLRKQMSADEVSRSALDDFL